MRYFCRLLVCNALVAWSLTGCSTPASRLHEHAAAFGRLSPTDQQLVRHGRIRPGMSQEAVYVAWGEPDAKKSGGDGGKSVSETWVYQQRVTLGEPINSYGFYGPYHGLSGDDAERGFLPPYAYGGIGYEGVLRYQPRVRSLDAVRIAEFRGGQVDRYKSAEGTWHSANHPVVALTSAPRARRLPHLAQRPAKSSQHVVHHRKSTSAHRLSAGGGVHRLHPAAHAGTGKTGSQKLGAEGHGSHGSHAGHGAPHRLGHAHAGGSGHVRTSSA